VAAREFLIVAYRLRLSNLLFPIRNLRRRYRTAFSSSIRHSAWAFSAFLRLRNRLGREMLLKEFIHAVQDFVR